MLERSWVVCTSYWPCDSVSSSWFFFSQATDRYDGKHCCWTCGKVPFSPYCPIISTVRWMTLTCCTTDASWTWDVESEILGMGALHRNDTWGCRRMETHSGQPYNAQLYDASALYCVRSSGDSLAAFLFLDWQNLCDKYWVYNTFKMIFLSRNVFFWNNLYGPCVSIHLKCSKHS